MQELLSRLPELAAAHLRLSISALVAGLLISLPLGIAVYRRPFFRSLVLSVVGIVQTIPSLALLAFMVPLIGWASPWFETNFGLKVSSIGFGPALVALTIYGLLPILQNTVIGLIGVDQAYVEAARGVGMTESQVLRRVELPLALPVIIAGTRIATVWTVGMAVLATPVGASSLGDYIFVGLQTRNQASIAVGCVASALMALVLDGGIRAFQSAVQARARVRLGLLGLGFAAVASAAFAPAVQAAFRPSGARIGAKAFTEAYLMAEIFKRRLGSAGLESEVIGSLGSTVIFDALVNGDIDLYLDFSGTILVHLMKEPVPPGGKEVALARVRQWLLREHDVRIAAVLGYENKYAFALRRRQAEQLGLEKVSDLVDHHQRLSLVASYEFFDRPEWDSVKSVYGLQFKARTTMEQALAYEAVHGGARDVVVAFSTDARLSALDLKVLRDDRQAIPPYEAIVLVRGDFADARPEAMVALRSLEGVFREPEVRSLNGQVDQAGRAASDVAAEWSRTYETTP